MNPKNLLALLGRYSTDPHVEAALVHYAIRNRPEVRIDDRDTDGPVIETQSWVKNSRGGIEFGFQDEAAWIGLDETEFGKHPMILTEIYFFGKHVGVNPYMDSLPFSLQVLDDRETVRGKLIKFESTRHSYIRDTWDASELRVAIAFTDDESSIRFVACMLREPRLPKLGYAIASTPSVDTIVGLLGGALADPAIHSTFDPLGLQGRIDEIKETGEADLRIPYGLSLDFAVAAGTADPSPDGILLSSATFFEEREQGARGWPGKLPCGIRFDDSPETVMQKLGRPPDSQHDDEDNFSGVAMWHEANCTVRVFYDTMENRVLRVSVGAPGLWMK